LRHFDCWSGQDWRVDKVSICMQAGISRQS
jgi:hypothetical protein